MESREGDWLEKSRAWEGRGAGGIHLSCRPSGRSAKEGPAGLGPVGAPQRAPGVMPCKPHPPKPVPRAGATQKALPGVTTRGRAGARERRQPWGPPGQACLRRQLPRLPAELLL